jgi:hypothetical protein
VSDIVERIDALLANTPPADIEEFEVCRCLRDARAAIESLRLAIRRLAEQDATLSVCDGSVTVTLDATLTDAERETIKQAIGWIESPSVEDEAMPEDYLPITDTLRGLLERTKDSS